MESNLYILDNCTFLNRVADLVKSIRLELDKPCRVFSAIAKDVLNRKCNRLEMDVPYTNASISLAEAERMIKVSKYHWLSQSTQGEMGFKKAEMGV